MSGDAPQVEGGRDSAQIPIPGPVFGKPAETMDALQADVARVRNELVTCQRLATLGNIAAVVAHEFNNLMTAVLARSQDALARDDVPAMRKALERAVINSRKAVDITQHLLAFAGAPEIPLEDCSVAAAAREAIATATRPFDKDGIDVRVSVSDDIRVRARRVLLEQVLLNLLLNARRAIGRNGAITISARRDGDAVVVDLRDTGSGFSPEQLEKLVNPYLADDAGAPSAWKPPGFGLNTCRVIAHQHGATIEALANEGLGCTFRLRWAAAPAGS